MQLVVVMTWATRVLSILKITRVGAMVWAGKCLWSWTTRQLMARHVLRAPGSMKGRKEGEGQGEDHGRTASEDIAELSDDSDGTYYGDQSSRLRTSAGFCEPVH